MIGGSPVKNHLAPSPKPSIYLGMMKKHQKISLVTCWQKLSFPKHSMYGLYTCIKWLFVVNVSKYSSSIECLGLVHSGFPLKETHQFVVENPGSQQTGTLAKKKVQKTKRRGQSPRGRSLSLGGLIVFLLKSRFRGGFCWVHFGGHWCPLWPRSPLRLWWLQKREDSYW